MSRSKVVVFMVVMTFVLGVAIGHAVAGEKVRFRDSYTLGKWEQIEVGDEEGHVMAVFDAKGIMTLFEGKALPDGLAIRIVGTMDMNTETAVGSCQGYGEFTDKDGDKFFTKWQGKQGRCEEGDSTLFGGTGKYEGIKGKITWTTHDAAPGQFYSDCEAEVELP